MRRMRAAGWTDDGRKICPDCLKPTDPAEFFTSTGSRITYCKKCSADRRKQWDVDNPEKVKEKTRRHRPAEKGIVESDYNELLETQNGVCAICGTGNPGGRWGTKFMTDHDHQCCPTYKSCGSCIRGLLCANCNSAIGLLEDDPNILRRAADYIERFRVDNPELFARG